MPQATHAGPIYIDQLELSDAAPKRPVVPAGYRRMRILVRCHGEMLGYLDQAVDESGAGSDELHQLALRRYRDRVEKHLAGEGIGLPRQVGAGTVPAPTADCPSRPRQQPRVTLVVCTRDRAHLLQPCLTALQRLDYPRLDIVIVDNAPSDDATRSVFDRWVGEDDRFRYVVEPRPGLSCARNKGLAQARGEIVAYTDDDATVEPDWISWIVRAFERAEGVGCVTGLVASASIEGDAEQYFDARVSWAHNTEPRLYDMNSRRDDNPLYPYTPGLFGTGANFAFRKAAIDGVGGFDEALGAGTLTKGGEDLDAFVRLLRTGWVLAYEPSAIVWHRHRSNLDDLRKQMYGYGTGLSAFVTKHLLDKRSRRDVLRRIPHGVARLATSSRKAARTPGPATRVSARLILLELWGFVVGPVLYVRAHRRARNLRQNETYVVEAANTRT